MNLWEEARAWVDTEAYARDIVGRFTACVNADPVLKEHRDFVEKHVYGFGERAFHHMWKLIVAEMPRPDFRFLEVGVYKGQVLSLVRLLAPEATVVGVTLLSSFSGTGKFPPFPETDYRQHIIDLHDRFDLTLPILVVGDSTDPETQQRAARYGPFDIVYVDGCHELAYVTKDLLFYPTLLKEGGFLVVDDASCNLQQPWGFFRGIADVSEAVRRVIESDPKWEHMLAVMHNRVFRKARQWA